LLALYDSPLWMHGLQFIILAQPIFWTRLYKLELNLDGYATWFHALSIMVIPVIDFLGFGFAYYKPHLFIQYVVLVNVAVYLYRRRYNFKDALCLGFLTVFLNSYYWEIILHLAEYLTVGYYHPAQLVPLWRLVPAYWLHRHYRFTLKGNTLILIGPLFSLAVYLYRTNYKFTVLSLYLMPLNRLVCLLVLVASVLMAVPRSQVTS